MKRMAFFLALSVALAAIAGMAVFGLILMDASMMGHSDCVAATATGAPCPLSLMDAAFHHAALFGTLSSAPAVGAQMILILVAISVIAFLFVLSRGFALEDPPLSRAHYFSEPALRSEGQTRAQMRWISLFEHSPSL